MIYLFLLISIVPLAHSDCDSEKALCETKRCNLLGEEIMSHVNLSVSPFVDPEGFYCSNYSASDTIELFTSFANMIQNVLEEEYNGPPKFAAVSKLYKSCARSDKDVEFHKQVERFVAELGGCPLLNRTWSETDFDLEKTVGILFAKHGIDTLFNLDFFPHTIRVKKSSDGLKALQNKTRFHRLFQSFSAAVFLPDELDRSMSEVLYFQQGINKAWNHPGQQIRSDEIKNLSSRQNYFEWTKLLDALSVEAGIPSDNSSVISVNYNVLALNELQKFVQKTPKRIIANFLIWKLINSYDRDQIFTDQLKLAKPLQEEPLGSRCTIFVFYWFNDFVDKILTDKIITESVKNDLETISQIAKAAVNNYVDKQDWLDHQTKIKVHEKIKTLKLWVGTDKYFKRYRVLERLTGDNFAKDSSIINLANFKDQFSDFFNNRVYDNYPRNDPKPGLIVYSPSQLFFLQYVENGPLVSNVATVGSELAQNFYGVIQIYVYELFRNQSLEKYTALKQKPNAYNVPRDTEFKPKPEAGLFPELFKAFKSYVDQNGVSKSSVRLPGALTNYSISTDFLLSYTNQKCFAYGEHSSNDAAISIVKEYASDMLKRC